MSEGMIDHRVEASLETRSVLIADDNEAIRSQLRLVLEETGYKVVAEADSGIDALVQVTIHQPDIVVLDEDMPRMSGSHAARLIRLAAPGIGIVICSGVVVDKPSAVDAVVPKEDAAYLPLALDRLAR
jgi:CheY-like chemotaxis protein